MGGTFSFAGNIGMDIDTAFDGLKIMYRKGTDNYVSLLVAMEPYTTFASFTYMVENDKAIYVTGYAKTPDGMPTLEVADEKLPFSAETMAAIEAHLSHVREGNTAAMAADYAPDAVILTNLAENPLTGSDGVQSYCKALLEYAKEEVSALTAADTDFQLKNAVGEIGCLALKQKASGKACINTFRIQNGKIVFEAAMFEGITAVI